MGMGQNYRCMVQILLTLSVNHAILGENTACIYNYVCPNKCKCCKSSTRPWLLGGVEY